MQEGIVRLQRRVDKELDKEVAHSTGEQDDKEVAHSTGEQDANALLVLAIASLLVVVVLLTCCNICICVMYKGLLAPSRYAELAPEHEHELAPEHEHEPLTSEQHREGEGEGGGFVLQQHGGDHTPQHPGVEVRVGVQESTAPSSRTHMQHSGEAEAEWDDIPREEWS
jgi:hypothetical protein